LDSQVVFYRLGSKIVSSQKDIPDDARQVMYYSLAIGHHVGVMDCFSEVMAVPANKYMEWLDRMPEGEARRKLEGVLKWQEIEINRDHVGQLLPALNDSISRADDPDTRWIESMIGYLKEMLAEPALYLMVKMRA
jgi:hydrogenase-4 component J